MGARPEGREEHEEKKDEDVEDFARLIVDSGLRVHRQFGPGLLGSVHERCLARELETRGVAAKRRVALPVTDDTVRPDAGYRIDLPVVSKIIVEVKAIETLTGLHEAQILTYLKLSRHPIGFLLDFNVNASRRLEALRAMIRTGLRSSCSSWLSDLRACSCLADRWHIEMRAC